MTLRLLTFLLLVKAVLFIAFIHSGKIGLSPDEAQYWSWSQALDWGYYSKPPAIAWQIALTSSLLGNTLLGVRLGALLIGLALSFALYALARAAGLSQKSAFWAGFIAAFTPWGFYLSLAATTDGGSILFLTFALLFLIQTPKAPPYLFIGLLLGLGGLYKWTVFLFWPFVWVAMLWIRELRHRRLIAGVALSLLAFLPSLYWNATHQWATWRHVAATVKGGESLTGNLADFVAAQVGLFSPFFFLLLLLGYFCFLREKEKAISLRLIAGFSLILGLYVMAAVFKKMQPNWAVYVYPAAFVMIVWVAERLRYGQALLHWGVGLSLLLCALLFLAPWLPLPYKYQPFKQTLGWDRLLPALLEAGFEQREHFLFAERYQTVSLLNFYVFKDAGPSRRLYFFNLAGSRKNQFSYWPSMQECEQGEMGYFVAIETNPHEASRIAHASAQLAPYFSEIFYKGAYTLYSARGQRAKYALIFACTSYNGLIPSESGKW